MNSLTTSKTLLTRLTKLNNSTIFPTMQSSLLPGFGNFVCVSLDGSNMVLCSQGSVPTGDPYTYLYWSDNYGETLNIATIGGSVVNFFGCVAISGQYAIAMGRLTQAGTNNFYLSSDYGHTYTIASGTWTAQGAGAFITMSGAIALWTNNNISVYRSTDYGNTWTNIGFSGRGGEIKIYGSNAYICRGGDGFWYSSNSGLTFTKTTTTTTPIRCVTLCGTTLYVGGDNIIYKSTNNGVTLTAAYSTATIRSCSGIASYPGTNGDFVWAGTSDTQTNFYTNDSGATWSVIATGVPKPRTCCITTSKMLAGSASSGGFYWGRNAYII